MRKLLWIVPVLLILLTVACGEDDMGDSPGSVGNCGAVEYCEMATLCFFHETGDEEYGKEAYISSCLEYVDGGSARCGCECMLQGMDCGFYRECLGDCQGGL